MKLLLLLLALPFLFSCGGSLDKELTSEMLKDGYSGKGTYTNDNGNNYVGEFKDGKVHGQGTLTYVNGAKYVGEYKDGMMHGQGTLTFAFGEFKGDKFVGEWKDNNKLRGTYTWENGGFKGDIYEGEWKDDKMHGQGTYTSANGDKYAGEFMNGKFIGE
jgi:hypothetical protein